MDISWAFSVDGFMGTRAAAIGFAAAAGAEVESAGHYTNDAANLSPLGYSFTVEVPAPATYDTGTAILRFVGRAGVNLTAANVTMTYGGLPVTIANAYKLQDTEIDVIDVLGYVYFGDVAELASEDLVVTISGVVSPNVVSGFVEGLFVNGLEDAAPTLFTDGIVDTYETPLALPGVDDFDFVFTTASQAGFAVSASVLAVTDDEDLLTQYAQVSESSNLQISSASWANDCVTSFDCDCVVDTDAKTLAQLRTRLLVRTGYATQASNAPAGVVLQYNDYLQSAQEYIYHRYKALQTKRLFAWDLLEGTRYYGLYDNANCCAAKLNRYKIEGAWIQDLNNTWWPLIYGIDPTFYTLNENLGWPNFFEVRSCVEVFPAPQVDGYKLWIKGNSGLLPFTDNTDITTIDAEPVFLWALGLAKSHKGDRDAGSSTPGQETGYYGQAIRYVKDLIAGAHVNRRYIPGSPQIPLPTPPVMVSFD